MFTRGYDLLPDWDSSLRRSPVRVPSVFIAQVQVHHCARFLRPSWRKIPEVFSEIPGWLVMISDDQWGFTWIYLKNGDFPWVKKCLPDFMVIFH